MSELAAPADDRGRVARGPQDRAVLRAVARLATLAAAPGNPDDVLRELCGVAAQVLEVDGIGVMKLEPGGPAGRVELVHAETPVHDLERLQGSLQPGRAATRSTRSVSSRSATSGNGPTGTGTSPRRCSPPACTRSSPRR